MTWILSWILLTVFWVLGLTIVTQPGMLLYFIRERAEKKKSSVYDALIRCHWCMPSIHGIAGYLFALATGVINGVLLTHLAAYPIIVCGSSFACGLLWALYKKTEIQIKNTQHIEQLNYFDLKDRKANHRKSIHKT
jgi:hypothetical protein